MDNLHDLPKFRDGLSHLYVEKCHVDQEAKSIAIHDANGRTPAPASSLALLMLGPGTTITHAAIRALADNGCLVVWCGEGGVRFYAQGMGETRHAWRLIEQARLASHEDLRMRVAVRMYQKRFPDPLEPGLTIEQIRGREGIRVRTAYGRAARRYGIQWQGRNYDRQNWRDGDPANRALSAANSCLYGLCHAAILSSGYSPALGFIHTGKQLSFVYDIADLYKTEIAVPVAFQAAAEGAEPLGRNVRIRCRDIFRESRLLERIIPDIREVLDIEGAPPEPPDLPDIDADPAMPMPLWTPESQKRQPADTTSTTPPDEEPFPPAPFESTPEEPFPAPESERQGNTKEQQPWS